MDTTLDLVALIPNLRLGPVPVRCAYNHAIVLDDEIHGPTILAGERGELLAVRDLERWGVEIDVRWRSMGFVTYADIAYQTQNWTSDNPYNSIDNLLRGDFPGYDSPKQLYFKFLSEEIQREQMNVPSHVTKLHGATPKLPQEIDLDDIPF